MTYSKLDAVNEMLEGLGESPVTALDPSGTSLHAEAESVLERTRRRVLMMGPREWGGWWANSALDLSFTPDGSGNILLPPATYLWARPRDWSYQTEIRDGKLYNLRDFTDVWTITSIKLDVIVNLAWDQLTHHLKDYVAAAARLDFVRFKKRGAFDEQIYRDLADRAKAVAVNDDLSKGRLRVFDTAEHFFATGERTNVERY